MKNDISVSVVEKPERKVLIRRAKKAKDYFDYCVEVGCDVWNDLKKIASSGSEPICLWLTESLILPGTSQYVQGVEVAIDQDLDIPDGYDLIHLPKTEYLMFQGAPFVEDEFEAAIDAVWEAIADFDPSSLGYMWDIDNPRIQLEPIGSRGYVELVAIKKLAT